MGKEVFSFIVEGFQIPFKEASQVQGSFGFSCCAWCIDGTQRVIRSSLCPAVNALLAGYLIPVLLVQSKLAAAVIYDGKGADAVSDGAKEFDELQNSIGSAARRGYVDQIIAPEDTRKYVIGAFDMLYSKAVDIPDKKHAAIW
jgi:hypothetical protein